MPHCMNLANEAVKPPPVSVSGRICAEGMTGLSPWESGLSPYLGEVWAGSVPLAGALAPRSSTGDVHTGLLEANSKAYCRTSTKGNRLGPEP